MRECPHCLVATRVIGEDKPFAGYGLARKHECRVCKRVYESLEIPLNVVRAIGVSKVRNALGQFGRGMRRAVESAKLATEALKMSAQGIDTHLVAHALGRTTARIRQINAQARRKA